MKSTIHDNRLVAGEPTSLKEWSDEALLLAYQEQGAKEAFDQLVHRYESELYNYLRRYLGDAQMAEDVFQATFLQVHLKCDQFETGRRVRPWLYTVATHQAIDAQRRNRRHRMVSLDRSQGEGENADQISLAGLIGGSDPEPFEQIVKDEWSETVQAAIKQLPETLQQVLNLVYYQGMKYRDAAEVLSIPVGTVKSRLHSAIKKLNKALTPSCLLEHG